MPDRHIAVALSGGGHRASLFGLGAMLYLMDAGKGPEIATVSSVSGGSITNGWMAATCDINDTTAEEFDDQASAFASKIALGGTLWADWMTYGLLALIAAIVVGAASIALSTYVPFS